MSVRRSRQLPRRFYGRHCRKAGPRRKAGLILAALTAGTLLGAAAPAAAAGVYSGNHGSIISGTDALAPGPGMNLPSWNASSHHRQYADPAALHLHGANFRVSRGHPAHFVSAGLTGAIFRTAPLIGADLTGAALIGVDVGGATALRVNPTGTLPSNASLTSASLGSAGVTTNGNGTAAILRGADLRSFDLTGAVLLLRANPTQANLGGVTYNANTVLTSASQGGLTVGNANLASVTGFTVGQCTTTASYLRHDLTGAQTAGGVMVNGNMVQTLSASNQNRNLSALRLIDDSGMGGNLAGAEPTSQNLTGVGSSSVPEPGSLALIALGAGAVMMRRGRGRK